MAKGCGSGGDHDVIMMVTLMVVAFASIKYAYRKKS